MGCCAMQRRGSYLHGHHCWTCYRGSRFPPMNVHDSLHEPRRLRFRDQRHNVLLHPR
jgi:hypothetical protein